MNKLKNIEKEITTLQRRLKLLYARRRELLASIKSSKPTKISSDQRKKDIYAKLRDGLSIKDISDQINLNPNTVKHYAWSAIIEHAQEELLKEGKASVVRPNQYGGATWTYNYRDLQDRGRKINSEMNFPLRGLWFKD